MKTAAAIALLVHVHLAFPLPFLFTALLPLPLPLSLPLLPLLLLALPPLPATPPPTIAAALPSLDKTAAAVGAEGVAVCLADGTETIARRVLRPPPTPTAQHARGLGPAQRWCGELRAAVLIWNGHARNGSMA